MTTDWAALGGGLLLLIGIGWALFIAWILADLYTRMHTPRKRPMVKPATDDFIPVPVVPAPTAPMDFTNESAKGIPGYVKLPPSVLANIEYVKRGEERILRYMDSLKGTGVDERWLALSRTSLQMAAMQVVRALAQPVRIALPEDDLAVQTPLEATGEPPVPPHPTV